MSSGSGEIEGESRVLDDDDSVSRSRSRSSQSSSSSNESGGRGRSASHSYGGSRSLVPITRHDEFTEETGRQFYSLEEEWERFVARTHRLGKREALIKVYNRPVIQVITPEIVPERRDERLEQFRTTVLRRCQYVKPVAVVMNEIEARRKELAELTEASENGSRPFKVKSFKE
jgi:hypothetical protein